MRSEGIQSPGNQQGSQSLHQEQPHLGKALMQALVAWLIVGVLARPARPLGQLQSLEKGREGEAAEGGLSVAVDLLRHILAW